MSGQASWFVEYIESEEKLAENSLSQEDIITKLVCKPYCTLSCVE